MGKSRSSSKDWTSHRGGRGLLSRSEGHECRAQVNTLVRLGFPLQQDRGGKEGFGQRYFVEVRFRERRNKKFYFFFFSFRFLFRDLLERVC